MDIRYVFLFTAVWSLLTPPILGVDDDSCFPCNFNGSSVKVDQYIQWAIRFLNKQVDETIDNLKRPLNVHTKDASNFDLTECCGESYAVNPTIMKLFSVPQLITKTQINLYRAASVVEMLNQKKVGTSLSRTALRSEALRCAVLHRLDSAPRCMSTAQARGSVNTTNSKCNTSSYTCRINMTFRFLYHASGLLQHITTRV